MSLQTCPNCGKEIRPGAPAGMCPTCLLGLGFGAAGHRRSIESPHKTSPLPFADRSFGHYELQDELARGGMGIVFRARQISLNRTVAVKLVHGGVFATPAQIRRFKLEAETAARLDHLNIVPTYEVGEHDGQPYFSMRLVEGGTLLDAMKRRRFTPREAVRLVKTVASAVHFAHQRGILHRDLKPTNILLDAEGCPHITDFGLAKVLEDDSDLTLTLAVMGTPAYMSPEQAAGKAKDLTIAADVYSLGAVLYELLSGRPPFSGNTAAAVLRQVVEAEPPSLRKRNPAVDADLETICLKCLEKNPARRYGSAGELADELERWLDGRPILARPVSAAERLSRWAKRNPLLAVLSAALVSSLVICGFMLDRAYWRTQKALAQSREAETRAVESLYHSMLTQTRAQLAARDIGQRYDVVDTLQEAARIHPTLEVRTEAVAALVRADFRRHSSWRVYIPNAATIIGFSPDLQTYVAPKHSSAGGCELRASESGKLLRSYPYQAPGVTNVRLRRSLFSPDGRSFAAFYDRGAADVWAVDGEKPIAQLPAEYPQGNVEFTPDSRQFVGYSTEQGLCVWTLADGTRQQIQPPGREPRFLRLNPAGDRLAVAWRESVEVLSFPDGRSLWTAPLGYTSGWAAWHPDGRSLAVASTYSRDIQIYDAGEPTVLARLVGHTHDPVAFEFHPNGQWLLSVGAEAVLRFWDARSGQELLRAPIKGHHALQFSRDGRRFVTSTAPHEVGFYELAAPQGFREFAGTVSIPYHVHNLDLSPSGRFLISGGGDGLRIWDTRAAREAWFTSRPSSWKHNAAYHVFFGPDDREIIYSRRYDGTYRREITWREGSEGESAAVKVGPELGTPVPRTTFLCSVGLDRRTWLSRDATNADEGAIVLPDGRMEGSRTVSRAYARLIVSLSPDGRWSAAVCNEDRRQLEIWDARNLIMLTNMGNLHVLTAAFSPDSRWLVAASERGHHLWETGTWKEAFFYRSSGQRLGCLAFAANGRRLAVLQPDDTILLVSLPEGRELLRLKPPFALMVMGLALSADGSRLWALGVGHRVYEWDLTLVRQELVTRGLDWLE